MQICPRAQLPCCGKPDALHAPPMPLGATTSATPEADEQVTGEFGLPTAPVPGEPDWDAMRAALNGVEVPEPAAAETAFTAEAPVPAPPVAARAEEPVADWGDDELITEPGWPLPGDMDGGWEDGGDTSFETAAAPAPAPEAAAGETWLGQGPAAPSQPEPVAEEAEVEDDAMWAPDPAVAWKSAREPEAEVAPAPVGQEDAAWLGGDPSATAGGPEPEAVETPSWDDIPVSVDPVEPVADWGAQAWDGPAEPVAEETPAIGSWDAPAEPVAEETPAIGSWDAGWDAASGDAPAAEAPEEPSPWVTGDWSSATEKEPDLVGAGAESAATLAPEAPVEDLPATDWPAADPDDAWAPAGDDAWASAVAEATPPVTSWNVDDPSEWTPRPEPAPGAEVRSLMDTVVVPAGEPSTVAAPPAEVVAEVAPEPVAEPSPIVETVIEVPAEAPVAEAVDAPVAEPVDGLAWWDDVEPHASDIVVGETPDWMRGLGDERFTGRWSLGGMALQPGHQTLSGVTFRQPLDAAPVTWSLPTRGRPEAGTLVLIVEALMNCDAKDLKVLTDEGFAPSREGFTITLTASSTGPFAASGTFRFLDA